MENCYTTLHENPAVQKDCFLFDCFSNLLNFCTYYCSCSRVYLNFFTAKTNRMCLLLQCRPPDARWRCPQGPTPALSASFPGLTEHRPFLSPCRQRTATCPVKMALYNFKKIMVVPTAKVRSFLRFSVLKCPYFSRVLCHR